MGIHSIFEKGEIVKSSRIGKWIFLDSNLVARFFLLCPFFLMILIAGLDFRPFPDERTILQSIVDFSHALPFPDIRDYNEASGPLPFILFSILGKAFGFEIWKLRLANVFAACLAVNLFYNLCKREALPHPLISALTFLFFPYFYVYSFTIYTTNITELFGICVLLFYLQNLTTKKNLVLGSFFSTLAVYSRQFLLEQPVGLLLFEVARNFSGPKQNLLGVLEKNFWRWLIISLPGLLILPLFIIWKGVNPPTTQGLFPLQPILQHINFFPILIGFYFLPIVISPKIISLIRNWKILLPVLVILIPVYFLFPLIYSEDINFFAGFAGVIAHGLNILGQKFGFWAEMLPRLFLWFIGILIILMEILDLPYQDSKKKLLSFCIVFLVMILLVSWVWERFYVSVVPYVILLLHKSNHSRLLLLINLAYIFLVSVGYSYWLIALKGSGF